MSNGTEYARPKHLVCAIVSRVARFGESCGQQCIRSCHESARPIDNRIPGIGLANEDAICLRVPMAFPTNDADDFPNERRVSKFNDPTVGRHV